MQISVADSIVWRSRGKIKLLQFGFETHHHLRKGAIQHRKWLKERSHEREWLVKQKREVHMVALVGACLPIQA